MRTNIDDLAADVEELRQEHAKWHARVEALCGELEVAKEVAGRLYKMCNRLGDLADLRRDLERMEQEARECVQARASIPF